MLDVSFTYGDVEYFALILVRVTSFMFVAPFYGMNGTPPNRFKLGFGMALSVLIFGSVPKVVLYYDGVLGFAIVVMKEAVTGLLLGFSTMMCTNVAAFSGHMVDTGTGMSMVNEMDVTTRQQTSITGMLYNYAFMLMLIATGMHRYLISALVDTYSLIPVNGAVFNTDSLTSSMIMFMHDYLIIGFRIALPVFCTTLLVNCILGILAKVAPQLNMFVVGIQIKILLGLGALLVSISILPGAADMIFSEMRKMTVSIIEGMR